MSGGRYVYQNGRCIDGPAAYLDLDLIIELDPAFIV